MCFEIKYIVIIYIQLHICDAFIKRGSSDLLSKQRLAKLYICRRCLNKYAKIKYKNYELNYKYYYYHFKCSQCDGMHHIVKSVKPLYAWKLFFTDVPEPESNVEPEVKKALERRERKIKIKKWLNW